MEHKDITEEYLTKVGNINLTGKNLTEIPKELRGIRIWEKSYYCGYNEHLTSLEYMPNYIGGDFDCYKVPNLIVILPICLSTIEGNWYYDSNPEDLKKAFEIIKKIYKEFGAGVATLVRAKKALDEAGLQKFCYETLEEAKKKIPHEFI